ncbi:sensor histidine kinase [Variovorax saccharolyticus]|uniref:sensor histidine kinase n=1 Tax=Variovorax saccharolyticus TaxID=3053516 RepID=UPI002577F165|nr:ATP-binding protein [Variovorax sp. J31P216]MDM0025403.1 ATP-binding protein [Variovorax sp. J31P216]
MTVVASQAGPLLGLVAVVLTVAVLSISGRQREHKGLDLAMALGLLAWMVFLAWQARFSPTPPGPVDEFIEHMGYQLCVAAACTLVLTGTRIGGRLTWIVWVVQVAGGGAVLLAWTWLGHAGWFYVWEATNWLIVGAVLALLLWRWPSYRREKVVGTALLSVVLLLYCLVSDLWHHPTSRLAVAGMFIYPTVLVALWSLVTTQLRARAQAASRGLGDLQRQRIAQDVHDGVGSQLVSILSSLDLKNPEQQALAMALEQCLLDLKITVDTLQQDSPSLVEGLAMLRYRIQPSLGRLGVELHWKVEDHPALERLPSLSVTHSLRIAQEAVANVMRHAGASELTMSCRCLQDGHGVELQVVDNGRGMPPASASARHQGRGLRGMQRRAEEAGLRLAITDAPGRGTAVRLTIPVPAGVRAELG